MKRLLASLLIVFVALPAMAIKGGKPFFRNVTAVEYNGHNRNFDINCDSTGRVYVANFEGLVSWDGLNWKMIHTPGISRITCLFRSADNRLWIGGYNVLGYLEDNGELFYISNDKDAISFGEVSNIYQEDEIIHFDTDVAMYHLNGMEIVRDASLDEQGSVSSVQKWHGMEVNQMINIPDQGLRAYATKADGVFFVDKGGNVVFSLSEEDGLCSNNVVSISYDGKGSVWGATNNGLFQISVSPVFLRYGATDGLTGQVTTILSARGTIYAGTLQGLFELGNDDRFHKVEGLDLACWQIVGFKGNSILAATAQGLYRYDGKLSRITERHTLCIHVEGRGDIITGEVDGIYRINDNGTSEQLSDASNIASFQRVTGGLWAINYYGETYFLDDGQPRFRQKKSDDMSLLLKYTDKSGRVWRPGFDNRGLSCDALFPSQIRWCKSLDAYNVEAVEIDGNDLYIGGNFGLIHMNLAKMKEINPYEPKIQVRSLNVDKYTASYSVSMDKTDPIGSAEYSYCLTSSQNWSDWSNEGRMNFGRMDIGSYDLSVRCRDSFGNVSTFGPVHFTIQPPVYMKWYAVVLYLAILVGMAYLFFRIRLIKARKEQERLEGIVNERTQELKDAQGQLLRQEREATVGKLTKGLIDRILNPMNYINNFSHLSIGLANDLAEDVEDEKDNMTADSYEDCVDICDMLKANLGKIEAHGLATTRILKAMEELLKDRSGKMEKTDMTGICGQNYEMARNYFKEDIDTIGLDLQLDAPSYPVFVEANPENISKCIMSILSNSVYAVRKKFQKAEDAKGEKPLVKMTLTVEGKGCRVEIYDNGIGIEESIIDKIFDPFFTTKPTGEAPGVGLYLCQQVVQDQGGCIKVESSKDEYTKVIIQLA